VGAAALAAGAAAPASLSVKVGGVGSSGGGRVVDARAALAHVYDHVLGVPGPAHAGGEAPLAELPATDLLSRPTHALLVTVDGAAGGAVALGGAAALPLDGAPAPKVLRLSASAAWARAGLSGASLEVVAPALGPAAGALPGGGASGALLRWEPEAGFVVAQQEPAAGAAAGAAYAGALLGRLACSEHGAALLAGAGITVAGGGGGGGGCPKFTLPDGRVLDAGAPGVAQALSEAAAIVGAAQALLSLSAAAAPAPGGDSEARLGLALVRVYAGGPAAAAAAGLPDGVVVGCVAALEAAVAAADSLLRAAAAAGGGHHAVALLAAAAPAGAGAGTGARRLQVDPTDPCIDYGNCTSRSPAPSRAPGAAQLAEGIASFQIALWTAVLLAAALLAAAVTLLGMDAKKDPALYVSLVDAARSGKRD
jgi:hypothetical protein